MEMRWYISYDRGCLLRVLGSTWRLSKPLELSQFYCAICGGPFKAGINSFFVPDDDETLLDESDEVSGESSALGTFLKPKHCDKTVLDSASIAWLHELLLLGWNPRTRKCFFTGPGVARDYRWALVQPGEDQEVPLRSPEDVDGNIAMGVYCKTFHCPQTDEESLQFPIHTSCLHMFQKALDMRKGTYVEIEKEALFTAMNDRDFEVWITSLNSINYFEFQFLSKQRLWIGTAGFEVSLPTADASFTC